MKFKFEKLVVWQQAMDFGEEIFKTSGNFPREEIFNLTLQRRRAADSIALNISEGAIDQSPPEFKKFLGYSIRSTSEVVTCLHKAIRRKYITQARFDKLYEDCFNLMNMLVALRKKLT
jgi:four helix bundle protein